MAPISRTNPSPNAAAAQIAAQAGPLTNGQDIRNRPDLLKMMVDKANAAGVPPELVLMTMGVESGFHQNTGGDRDSVGLFQQRPSCGWGTPAQCMDPAHAVDEFLKHAVQYKGQFGTSPQQLGAWCQKVQGSAFPDRYQGMYGEAQRILGAIGSGTTPGGTDLPAGAGGSGGAADSGGGGGGAVSSSGGGSGGGGGGGVSSGGGSSGSSGASSGSSAENSVGSSSDLLAALLAALSGDDDAATQAALQKLFPKLSAKQLKTLGKMMKAHPELAKALQGNPQEIQQLANSPELKKVLDTVAMQDVGAAGNVDANALLKGLMSGDAFADPASAPVDIKPELDAPNLSGDPLDAGLVKAVQSLRPAPTA